MVVMRCCCVNHLFSEVGIFKLEVSTGIPFEVGNAAQEALPAQWARGTMRSCVLMHCARWKEHSDLYKRPLLPQTALWRPLWQSRTQPRGHMFSVIRKGCKQTRIKVKVLDFHLKYDPHEHVSQDFIKCHACRKTKKNLEVTEDKKGKK